MILVDTSVWIQHLRTREQVLEHLLGTQQVLMHPFIVGELLMGSVRDRETIISDLLDLPPAAMATDEEVRQMVNSKRLYARGIGYIDAHLLASARITPEAALWTRDRRLLQAAVELGVDMRFD